MAKMALSIKKDFNPYTATLAEVLTKKAFLDDRAVCETNKEQLQIIPYITFVDTSGGAPKYFAYMRGTASGESRLTGNVSIGIGGHIEEEPTGKVTIHFKEIEKTLAYVIANGAKLECHEEVGMEFPIEIMLMSFEKQHGSRLTLGDASATIIIPEKCILYNELNDVSCVHLGVHILIEGNSEDLKSFGFGTMEEGIITKGQWYTFSELSLLHGSEQINLEEWSLQVLRNLYPDSDLVVA